VRGGSWFIERPYEEQARGFNRWLAGTAGGSLALLDIGTGFNTPSVVRWPMEQITARHPNAFLIRVNTDHPEIDERLRGRSLSLRQRAGDFLEAMTSGSPAGG
jgi:hypothetical protein